MLTVLGGLAEFERELIRARTGEGRKRGQGNGRQVRQAQAAAPFQQQKPCDEAAGRAPQHRRRKLRRLNQNHHEEDTMNTTVEIALAILAMLAVYALCKRNWAAAAGATAGLLALAILAILRGQTSARPRNLQSP